MGLTSAWMLAIGGFLSTGAALDDSIPGLRAHLRALSQHIPLNHPVQVEFSIENTSSQPLTLTVPGTEPQIPPPEMGLPLAHVFSGGSNSGVTVSTEAGRHWDQAVSFRTPTEAPVLLLGARSTVGTTLDLREYFPVLRGAGQYRVTWKPYAGGAVSETIVITIAPRKQVELVTDDGTLTISLFYDDAPLTVANFLELSKSGFYTGKTFHRIEPGYMIQGGCPRGDGTGIRLDGKRVPAEFNSRPHQKGSLSMALLDDDPDSASCQFFICNTRQKDWDGRYTVFGELLGDDSFATLDRLMAVPVDDFARPRRPLYIRAVRLLDEPASPTP
jgi:cyclophilin family peptidyl-prolyl cis-trans isomerase